MVWKCYFFSRGKRTFFGAFGSHKEQKRSKIAQTSRLGFKLILGKVCHPFLIESATFSAKKKKMCVLLGHIRSRNAQKLLKQAVCCFSSY
jgi:hypothetical protein